MKTLKSWKEAGLDEVISEITKNRKDCVGNWLQRLCNSTFEIGRVLGD